MDLSALRKKNEQKFKPLQSPSQPSSSSPSPSPQVQTETKETPKRKGSDLQTTATSPVENVQKRAKPDTPQPTTVSTEVEHTDSIDDFDIDTENIDVVDIDDKELDELLQ
jgi:hypothetical protein